jgi:hypothetical protein
MLAGMKPLRLDLSLAVWIPGFVLLGAFSTHDSGSSVWLGLVVGGLVGVFFGLIFGGAKGRWLNVFFGPEESGKGEDRQRGPLLSPDIEQLARAKFKAGGEREHVHCLA